MNQTDQIRIFDEHPSVHIADASTAFVVVLSGIGLAAVADRYPKPKTVLFAAILVTALGALVGNIALQEVVACRIRSPAWRRATIATHGFMFGAKSGCEIALASFTDGQFRLHPLPWTRARTVKSAALILGFGSVLGIIHGASNMEELDQSFKNGGDCFFNPNGWSARSQHAGSLVDIGLEFFFVIYYFKTPLETLRAWVTSSTTISTRDGARQRRRRVAAMRREALRMVIYLGLNTLSYIGHAINDFVHLIGWNSTSDAIIYFIGYDLSLMFSLLLFLLMDPAAARATLVLKPISLVLGLIFPDVMLEEPPEPAVPLSDDDDEAEAAV